MESLSNDLLDGADAIAEFIGLDRKRVYHLCAQGQLPSFKLGGKLIARKSAILARLEKLEEAGNARAAG